MTFLSAQSFTNTISFPNAQYQVLGHAFRPEIQTKLTLHENIYVFTDLYRPELDTWETAPVLRSQITPFNTIIVNKNTSEAYKIAAFDPSDYHGPLYGYIPIYSNGNFATAAYNWTYLPEPRWVELGMHSTSILDMLNLDQATLTYILKDSHSHLLAAPASESSSSSRAAAAAVAHLETSPGKMTCPILTPTCKVCPPSMKEVQTFLVPTSHSQRVPFQTI